jgi:hypothetical protein
MCLVGYVETQDKVGLVFLHEYLILAEKLGLTTKLIIRANSKFNLRSVLVFCALVGKMGNTKCGRWPSKRPTSIEKGKPGGASTSVIYGKCALSWSKVPARPPRISETNAQL